MKTWSSAEKSVLFVETDASGWVHNSHFMRYVENAEHELFFQLGVLPIETGSAWPRVHFEIDFRSPLVFNDPYHIALSVIKIGNSSVRWGFQILSGARLIAEGNMVSVRVGDDRKSLRIDDRLRDSLSILFS